MISWKEDIVQTPISELLEPWIVSLIDLEKMGEG
jgi:hypothetical protein